MASSKSKVAVIGSGNWGSVAAKLVASNTIKLSSFHDEVRMWVFEETLPSGEKLSQVINKTNENVKYLPGIKLGENVVADPDVESAVRDANMLVFVTPHQFIDGICKKLVGKIRQDAVGISLIKGMDLKPEGPNMVSKLIKDTLQIDCCVLMGANIANEIAMEQFSEATVGYEENKQIAQEWVRLFNTSYFLVSAVQDVEGVELCGTLKNVVAVAAGLVDGLGMGNNTKAAIMRIGLNEMRDFCKVLFSSVKDTTFFESCGVADLITTCLGGRNRKCAEAFAKNGGKRSFEELEAEMLQGQKLQACTSSTRTCEFWSSTPPTESARGPPLPPGPGFYGAGPSPPLMMGNKAATFDNRRGRAVLAPQRSNLKPLHWSKVTRASDGSLWEKVQRRKEPQSAQEIDVSVIEPLLSAAVLKPNRGTSDAQKTAGPKTHKVQLIEHRRAFNTEIMLIKIKMPLPDMMGAALAMDESILDADQVENILKFRPAKEEIELLKGYTGDKEKLGRCEQLCMELMTVPRVDSKLQVFLFKIRFKSQISDLRRSLNAVNVAYEEVQNSDKLKQIMSKISFLGNTLYQGTRRGSAAGFKLGGLLKLTDTRATNNKMTLMHYLCKAFSDKLPHLVNFHKDLVGLEAASKIQLKFIAEEMQELNKGLEKARQELGASENDDPVSEVFVKTLKEFIGVAETEVTSVQTLYSVAGKNADALVLYFNEDPAWCPSEFITTTLLKFVRSFKKAHDENCKQEEMEKQKKQKQIEMEKSQEVNLNMKGVIY